jgi:hypothetical protein
MKAADPVGDRRASFWSVPTEALFQKLKASAGGLTHQEAQERLARYGLLLAIVQVRTAVLRDGSEQELPLELVVPGDVVVLNAGDVIQAIV